MVFLVCRFCTLDALFAATKGNPVKAVREGSIIFVSKDLQAERVPNALKCGWFVFICGHRRRRRRGVEPLIGSRPLITRPDWFAA